MIISAASEGAYLHKISERLFPTCSFPLLGIWLGLYLVWQLAK